MTFSINVKSLVCSPSPKITGDCLLRIARINFGIAAAYSPFGSCLGPNTLKYLNPIHSIPYKREKTDAYNSLVSFETAYGLNGFPNCPSDFGSTAESPY